MAAQGKRSKDYKVANRYLNDAERFAETHDPAALARQIPKKVKQARGGAKPAEHEADTDRAGN